MPGGPTPKPSLKLVHQRLPTVNPPMRRTLVLHRPADRVAQFLSRVNRPVRVTQELARQQNNIGLALPQGAFGLCCLSNHPDRSRRDPGFSANAFGKRNLVPGPNLDLLAVVVPP